ncbi:Enoyl-CoA hydratase/carnithine racemase [Enhydrobacter aerosaccus]|uniref:Enoyl-CoA hydratase/carnithine racemase n=1 Tax=Enhydrobacter aerosaccus TaxID=225324 RepID=A0A1T4JYF0_9HYPH|nr:enoyl-CoA hydratase/isomerase family protein [Enhydrobacter aerosaccus]SJZ35211.1 Enoyl-CoA hydratase/carnithine racemase [Enhydrobacter aerosaccus]
MSALEIERQDEIAIVTLARPPMNAMTTELLEEASSVFGELAAQESVRAAVITGQGPAFSAGLDLKVVPRLGPSEQRRLIMALNDAFGALYAWPKPLVAAVNGHAIAGGLVLALCADCRIAADVALQVSLAEVKVAVTYPVAALEVARAELVPAAARRLILLGESLDMQQALSLGVFDRCVPPRSLLLEAVGQARRHAELPSKAFATIKRELRATSLARIAAARAGDGEPRLEEWLGEETRRAASAALRRPA